MFKKIIFIHYKFSMLAFLLTLFLMGFFVCEYGINATFARYEYAFSTSKDASIMIDIAYYDSVFEQIDDYNEKVENKEIEGKKISYAKIDYASMLKNASLSGEEEYVLSVQKSYFPSTIRSSNGTVNTGESRCKTYFNLVSSYGLEDIVFQGVKMVHYQNPFLIGTYTLFVGVVLLLSLLIVLNVLGKEIKIKDISDNQNIFRTPFHKNYWLLASKCFSKVKNLSTISILFALMMICKLIPIPSGFGSLGLSFTYLIFAVITMIYGPLCGIFIGFFSDILGFFLFQGGQVFFFGYTFDAMLAGLIYGLCFYKTKVTFAKCLTARFFVNMIVNICLGSFWWKIIYGLDMQGYITYMLVTSIPKNLLYLLPQSILLYVLFRALAVPLSHFGLIDCTISQNVSLF